MTFTPSGEKLIRGLLAKTTNRDTKGIATYALAQTLSNQSAMASRSGAAARAAKLTEEANGLYEQVLNEFGSLKLGNITLTDAVIRALGQSGKSNTNRT